MSKDNSTLTPEDLQRSKELMEKWGFLAEPVCHLDYKIERHEFPRVLWNRMIDPLSFSRGKRGISGTLLELLYKDKE